MNQHGIYDHSAHSRLAVDYPQKIYRFFKGEHGLSALVNGELKLTPPCEFNDPFEFAPGLDLDLKFSENEMQEHLLALKGLPRAAYCPKYAQNNKTEYAKWVKEAITKPDLFSKHVQCMRKGLTQAISMSFGVICFSAFTEKTLLSPQTIRHWSAYADDHRGLAIEFDGTKFNASKDWFFKVLYKSKRPYCKLKDFEDVSEEALKSILRTWGEVKLKCAWSAEKEWRMILPLAAKSRDQPIPITRRIQGAHLFSFLQIGPVPGSPELDNVIRRVILASRASKELETSVRLILKEPRFRNVSLCQVRLAEDSFAMRIEQI